MGFMLAKKEDYGIFSKAIQEWENLNIDITQPEYLNFIRDIQEENSE